MQLVGFEREREFKLNYSIAKVTRKTFFESKIGGSSLRITLLMFVTFNKTATHE